MITNNNHVIISKMTEQGQKMFAVPLDTLKNIIITPDNEILYLQNRSGPYTALEVEHVIIKTDSGHAFTGEYKEV